MKSSIVFGPSSHQFSAIVVSCVSVWLYLLAVESNILKRCLGHLEHLIEGLGIFYFKVSLLQCNYPITAE